MNAPLNSDSQLYSSESSRSVAASGYAPSVPISVYRELATELKTTQTTLDALTQQNQQLLRQNKLLRTEIQRFVQSAAQLGHFAGVPPQEALEQPEEPATAPPRPEMPATPEWFQTSPADTVPPGPEEPPAPTFEAPSTPPPPPPPSLEKPLRNRGKAGRAKGNKINSAIVPHPKSKKRDRTPEAPDANQYRLFTEQPDEARPLSKVASRSELSNLWLATTILLVVVSAFGAGFLIMRPLLKR